MRLLSAGGFSRGEVGLSLSTPERLRGAPPARLRLSAVLG